MGHGTVYVVAGGPAGKIPDLRAFAQKSGFWIGADRGVEHIVRAGLVPDLAVGDFDSVPPGKMQEILELAGDVKMYKPEKDETDMELAMLAALERKPDEIIILGATGGRLDHFMANALMIVPLLERNPSVSFKMIDKQNELSVHFPGSFKVAEDRRRYVSFIPLAPKVEGLTLDGFAYPLKNKTVSFGSSLCISNELAEQTGTFSFEKGILMMIRSEDLSLPD